MNISKSFSTPRTTGLDDLLRSRPWISHSVQLPNQPVGMLGRHEAELCYYLARDVFKGSGTIVDAGSFLGKSASYFAAGLRANPRYNAERDRIHCFDNFLVNEDGTVQFIAAYLNRTVAVGDSTREIFNSQVSPVSDMLEVHAGDFHVASWPPQPIEILMVDIAKSESLGKHVVEIFFSSLIPGESLVIHQDYHHPWLPHIHVTMEYLADYFDVVVPRIDDSAVFSYRSAIPQDVLERAIRYDFTFEEQLHLMDGAISRLPQRDRHYVQLARVVLQTGKTNETLLREEFNTLRDRFNKDALDYSVNPYFDDVESSLDEVEGWRCHNDGAYARCLELADKALARRPSTENMTMRGNALLGLERYAEAEVQLRRALEIRPASGYAYIALARALHHQERHAEAEAEVVRGIGDYDADVPSRDYFEMLSWIWRVEQTPRDRFPLIKALSSEFSADPEFRVLEAWAWSLSGVRDRAEASLNKASELGLSPNRVPGLRDELQLEAHPGLPE